MPVDLLMLCVFCVLLTHGCDLCHCVCVLCVVCVNEMASTHLCVFVLSSLSLTCHDTVAVCCDGLMAVVLNGSTVLCGCCVGVCAQKEWDVVDLDVCGSEWQCHHQHHHCDCEEWLW